MHVHRYKVMPESMFGLHRVNAVLVCQGLIDKAPCKHSMTKVLKYEECDKEMSKRGTLNYFWTDKVAVSAEGDK